MKGLRLLLYPLSLVYGAVSKVRNLFYDSGIFKEEEFRFPVIGFGNLTTGGTGKTPHTLYAANLLAGKYETVVLSRGYGRKTKGFRWVEVNDAPSESGDEPLMIKIKKPELKVAVDENRARGIKRIMEEFPETSVIIMDDAFQHRRVRPYPLILLTDYSKLFRDDLLLPAGNLRESQRSYKRADVIVVTKCPAIFSPLDRRLLYDKIRPLPHQRVFFSYLDYGNFVSFRETSDNPLFTKDYFLKREFTILLLTGIANPEPMQYYLTSSGAKVVSMAFPDHHPYTPENLKQVQSKFESIKAENKIILTTEKDYVRLRQPFLAEVVSSLPFFYLPVTVNFHDKANFDEILTRYVE